MTGNRTASSLKPDDHRQQAIWAILVLLRGLQRDRRRHPLRDACDDTCTLIGLDLERVMRLVDPRPLLRQRLSELEAEGPARHGAIFRNADLLGDALGLGTVERDLLAAAVVMHEPTGLSDAFATFRPLSRPGLTALLSAAFRADPRAVEDALTPQAPLAASGILHVGGRSWVDGPLTLLESLRRPMLGEHADIDALLSSNFGRAAPPSLDRADFSHVASDVDVLVRMLRAAFHERAPGLNVLLHGPPGTGKTELARLLAREASGALYEVNVADGSGDALDGASRLSAFVLCQRMLAGMDRAVVLFDEIEDVFPADGTVLMGESETDSRGKGWMNRTLETHPVPTIWVSNNIGEMDRAYLRRFDAIVELGTPPQEVRRRIVDRHLGALPVRTECRDRIAADERIAPAYVERSARAVRLTAPASPEEAEATLERILRAHADLVGPPPRCTRAPVGAYDLSMVTASHDVEALAAALVVRPNATLCLYGPPGTGKTAYVAHLAQRLGRPLLSRRGSDLLDMYVGGTEHKIAGAFQAARVEGAILFLDEADSFLQDRTRAHRSWEVTQVNELLTQMESFDGVFVCATNLVESLDHASLRRFDVKVRFDPLDPDRRWGMLTRLLNELGSDGPPPELRASLDALPTLTPGDFAVVSRQSRLLGSRGDVRQIMAALEAEVRLKRPGVPWRGIGFDVQ